MPTLTRIILFLALIGVLIYGAMFALAHFIKPTISEITIDIPASKINPVPVNRPQPPAEETQPETNPDAAADKQE